MTSGIQIKLEKGKIKSFVILLKCSQSNDPEGSVNWTKPISALSHYALKLKQEFGNKAGQKYSKKGKILG